MYKGFPKTANRIASKPVKPCIFAKINLSHFSRKRQEKSEPLGKNLVYIRRKVYVYADARTASARTSDRTPPDFEPHFDEY